MKEFFNNRYSTTATNNNNNKIQIRQSQPKPALKQKLASLGAGFQDSPFSMAEKKECENEGNPLLKSPSPKTREKTVEVENVDSPNRKEDK